MNSDSESPLTESPNGACEPAMPIEGRQNLRANFTAPAKKVTLVAESPAMQAVEYQARRIALSKITVLITGETGTGKEVVADLIHECGSHGKPLVEVNCAALPRELIESELFGSRKGSYTGSCENRSGLFMLAGDGTLVLDEIAEMSLDTQAKLLRVLQDRRVHPIGGGHAFYVAHCRIIASTNQVPEQAIKSGKLRQDLFYRINAARIHVPPLRERHQDIIPLAEIFLEEFARQNERTATTLTQQAKRRLLSYDWPGNVRELENMIQAGAIMTDNGTLDVNDLFPKPSQPPAEPSSAAEPAGYELTIMEQAAAQAIMLALRECENNKLAVSEKLGIGRQTVYNKMRKFGIPADYGRRPGPRSKRPSAVN